MVVCEMESVPVSEPLKYVPSIDTLLACSLPVPAIPKLAVLPEMPPYVEARMVSNIIDVNRQYPFRDQAGESLVQRHAQCTYATRVQAERGRQNQVRSIRLKQISRADFGPEPLGDQCHQIHEGIGGLASLRGKVRDLLQSEYETCIGCFAGLGHRVSLASRIGSVDRSQKIGIDTFSTLRLVCRDAFDKTAETWNGLLQVFCTRSEEHTS